MADENKADTGAKSKGSGKTLQMIIVLALMLGEGAAVYFVASAMGPEPDLVAGSPLEGQEDVDAEPSYAEVELAQCRPTNRKSGRQITLLVKVSALVLEEDAALAGELVEKKKSRILDRIQFIIRSAEIQHLNEPGLETVKRRLKQEMDRIFGDPELLKKILIPEWQQSGGGI